MTTALPWAEPALTSAGCCCPALRPLRAQPWHMSRAAERGRGRGGAQAQETPLHDDGKIAQGSRGAAGAAGAGAGWVLGRSWVGWVLVPAEEIWWPGPVRGSRWGSGCVPNAPDYLSVSLLGTRTGSEHGGRPGRPNWRPSQTVKHGECGGVGQGDWHGTAQHGTHCHPPWHPALHPARWCTHGEQDRGTRTRGFLVLLPAACPWFPLRNGEPRATGCSPLRLWPLSPLERETEACKTYQAMSQGQSLILQAPCSGDALHRAPTP